jgi:D-alanyl-D-alanine carboxypeptidase
MLRAGALLQRGSRWSALGLAAILLATTIASDASARSRRHHHHAAAHAAAAESYQPSYASIVVDANSGAVMQATNADSPRHPASLSKVMTLYLLFERLDAGKIKLTSEMNVSAHAAAQAPSKLGLKPGDTITVETAIRAIVTKSANDVAVIVAEALGGSEEEFARLMTAKARALGMMHTNYHNASGLPDPLQISTARDQAILARAIQDRFPKYFPYFATRTFEYHGKTLRNHNHLLGRIAGVDGMKTGYIHDSGFNIIVDMHRNNRHLVAVVFGGHTANARDARVVSLLDNNINIASAKRTAPPVGETFELAAAKDAGKELRKEVGREAEVTALAAQPAEPAPGSTDPIKPNPVKTISVEPGSMHAATLSPLPSGSRKLAPAPATANPAAITTVATLKSEPPANLPPLPTERPHLLGTLSAKAVAQSEGVKESVKDSSRRPAGEQVASAGDSIPVSDAAAKTHNGWMIQVGAFDDEHEAKVRLTTAKTKARNQLDRADPFTEKVEKGDKAMFRARFAGLAKDQAEAACKHLKRSEIPCMLLKN